MIRLLLNDEVYDSVIEHGLAEARHSVWIATANVKNLMMAIGGAQVRSSLDLFEEMSSKGINVRLLHSGVPSGPFLKALRSHEKQLAGGHFIMKRCVRIHLKCVLIDNRLLYMGSANFTGAGLGMKGKTRRNFEAGILTDEDEIMDRIADVYESIWDGKLCPKCGRKEQCIVPLESPF